MKQPRLAARALTGLGPTTPTASSLPPVSRATSTFKRCMASALFISVVPSCRLSHARKHLASGWTGRSYVYSWDGGGFDAHLVTTLPGPLFVPHGHEFHFRFAIDNGVPRFRALETGETALASWTNRDVGRLVLLENWGVPTLLASSSPISSLKWISHEHLTLTCAEPASRLLFVPLLKKEDVPEDSEAKAAWLRLAEKPPVRCHEFFETSTDQVKIRQKFFAPDGAPTLLSPLAVVAQFSQISSRPANRRLIHGLMGPYCVAEGDYAEYEIDFRWARTRAEATRAVTAQGLGPIPRELAYAGDVTWEPGTPMDQLLALRIWAPLAGVTPPSIWENLRPQLAPPRPMPCAPAWRFSPSR